jgi:hypothetical protein
MNEPGTDNSQRSLPIRVWDASFVASAGRIVAATTKRLG